MTEMVTSGSMSGEGETKRWITRREGLAKGSLSQQAPPILTATAPPPRLYRAPPGGRRAQEVALPTASRPGARPVASRIFGPRPDTSRDNGPRPDTRVESGRDAAAAPLRASCAAI